MTRTRFRKPILGVPFCTSTGAAVAAEFALVTGLMALVVSSLFELTLLLNQQVVLVQAAREGVRRAIVEGGDTGEVREVIAEQLRAVGMDPGRSAPKWRLGWSC